MEKTVRGDRRKFHRRRYNFTLIWHLNNVLVWAKYIYTHNIIHTCDKSEINIIRMRSTSIKYVQ